MRFLLTAGNPADCTQALQLIKGTQAQVILADRGYDADYILQAIQATGALPVIPSKSNRYTQRSYDQYLYKHHNLVERLFVKFKKTSVELLLATIKLFALSYLRFPFASILIRLT